VAADEAGEIARARKEIDFLEKSKDLVVICAGAFSETIQLLGERDLYSEVGGLGKLGELQRFRPGHHRSLHPRFLEMAPGPLRGREIGRRHKLHVV
jgi:hypothetical protein